MGQFIRVGGVPEGYDAKFLLLELAKNGRAVLHIARDDKRLAAMAEALQFFAPDVPVFTFPAWDCLPYDRVSPNAEISATRMATLAGLVHDMPKSCVVLTTLNAAMQRIPARSVIQGASFRATVGQRVNETDLRQFWCAWGFRNHQQLWNQATTRSVAGSSIFSHLVQVDLSGWIFLATC
jgi:transcription-repair coupling factor (superfamily II helicase)